MTWILSYALDDDEAAAEAVGHELNRPHPERWLAMTTGDRIFQTYRALGHLIKGVEVSFLKRRSELAAFRGSRAEYRQAKADHDEWKSRTVHFANVARDRRSQLKDRIRHASQERHIEKLNATLDSLLQAIGDHRQAIASGDRVETTADRLLWVRLHLVPRATEHDRTNQGANA